MLRDTLQAVVRAAQRCIETTCDWNIRNVAVHPVDDARVNVRLCTMLTTHTGPVKRILFCCDESLADHVADRIRLPDDERDIRAASAFRMLASVFDQSLETDTRWYRSAGEFCQFGPGAIRAEFHGSKSFRIKLPTPAGSVELLVQLSGRGEWDKSVRTSRKPSASLGDAEPLILTGEAVDNALDDLAELECEVQVGLPVRRDKITLREATIMARTTIDGRPVLTLCGPCLSPRYPAPKIGTKTTVYVRDRGDLLQFDSEVVSIVDLVIQGNAEIKLLALAEPAEISEGQRRGSFRIPPPETIHVDITPCRSLESDASTAPATRATVGDLSFHGMRVTAPRDTLVTRFTEGSLVMCAVRLPGDDASDPVRLAGVMRRVRRATPKSGEAHDTAGLQFLTSPSQSMFNGGTERLRAYILDAQRRVARAKRAA